ncbi:IclR family transcriptional regulator domain-containing protein [Glycomyces harbinensis]|uniref:Glycerol operon regulatory protein n=1 Tax=Glycomyces harbinensis TaxID=58114 RepID=A0A1G6W5H6_9ACTN|nr:IclR family transcriptional regulator C-terminal domain-containing protein [Glycomyces harbinensis]SDD60295.1 transcriptional regulator, IclR family [Glycomyces harbinensis]
MQPEPTEERGPETAAPRNSDYVQTLARGLAVIRAFSAERPELTLSEVAKETGLTRATARRFLLTLTELGYVRAGGRHFRLTPRVLELGFAYLSSLSLPELAQPHLERLVAEVQESASVAVLDGTDIVYVSRVATRRIMRVAINIGTRFPAVSTSMGRVLLADLDTERLDAALEEARPVAFTPFTITDEARLRAEIDLVRSQGWAFVDQELEEGLRSIAVPIRDQWGKAVAAMNVSSHTSRNDLDSVRRDLLPPLLAGAARVAADMAITYGTAQAETGIRGRRTVTGPCRVGDPELRSSRMPLRLRRIR